MTATTALRSEHEHILAMMLHEHGVGRSYARKISDHLEAATGGDDEAQSIVLNYRLAKAMPAMGCRSPGVCGILLYLPDPNRSSVLAKKPRTFVRGFSH